MLIKVCRSGRDSSSVNVPDNATVSDLKRAIELQEKVLYAEQTLTFNGLVLEDRNLISQYGLVDHCTVLLYLRLGFQPDFDLTVILSSKMKINLRISGEDTVRDLKKRVEKESELSLHDTELIYDHWVLDDDRKLMEYGISGGATILVVHELSDGPGFQLGDSAQDGYAQPIPYSVHRRHRHKTPMSSSDEVNIEENDSGGDRSNKELITVIFLPKTGSPIALKVHPSTPVGKVRGKLAKILHVPSSAMGFVRDGKSLDPSRTFAQYGISHGESVCLLSQDHVVENPKSWVSSEQKSLEPKIRIIVQSMNGHTLACHVRKITTVKTLKQRLERELNVPKSKMHLFYHKTMLADESKVEDYDLSDGCVVYLRY
nr:ubiquitin [Hymenolepis microstoma]